MNAPKPRRTAERILDVTLQLFNRFGEPNVSTSQLCGEMGISPGNLFYHHASRDALVLALFLRYQAALDAVLAAPPPASGTAPATGEAPLPALVALCRAMAGCARNYRFIFRDMDDLVSRHRALEDRLPELLRRQARALEDGLRPLTGPAGTPDGLWSGYALACLTGRGGLDGALDPRERRCGDDGEAVARATWRALAMLEPLLGDADRPWLRTHLNEGDRFGADPWYLRAPAA